MVNYLVEDEATGVCDLLVAIERRRSKREISESGGAQGKRYLFRYGIQSADREERLSPHGIALIAQSRYEPIGLSDFVRSCGIPRRLFCPRGRIGLTCRHTSKTQ